MMIFWKLSLALILSAYAYIPPSTYIFKNWVTQHKSVRNLKIKTLVTALVDGKPSDSHFEEMTHYSAESQRVVSWIQNSSGEILYAVERKIDNLSLVSRLLFQSDMESVVGAFREKGVPIPKESEEDPKTGNHSLVRWNGSLAWVIGSKESGAQIWFKKDEFFPVRVIFSDWDIRFEQFQKLKDIPYPHLISIGKNGAMALSAQTVEISVDANKKIPNELLNGFSALGESSLATERKLIEQYYSVVR